MTKKEKTIEVKERAERILNLPPMTRAGTINEFYNMADGESEFGIREKYYPGKPNQFFKDVLAIVTGGEE